MAPRAEIPDSKVYLNSMRKCFKGGLYAPINDTGRKAPLPSYLVRVIKEKVRLDCLLSTGWNMSEVKAEFEPDWLLN